MKKIKRRTMVKTLGALSVGVVAPSISNGEVLANPYSTKEKHIETDILVVGGGTAGTIAAIQAGRAGSRTVLVESGSQLGGTTTTGGVSFPGIFHAWGKQIIGGIGWEIVYDCVKLNGDKLPDFNIIPDNAAIRHWRHQIAVNSYLYVLLTEEKCLDAGVDIRYYETPISIKFKRDKWIVNTIGKGSNTQIVCKQIIDCTGNALIASMAGFSLLRDDEIQPGSFIYKLGGYNYDELDLEKIPQKYHGILSQNRVIVSNLSEHNFPSSVPYNYVYVPNADSTTSSSHTLANTEGRGKLLKLFRELQAFPGCENIKITDMKTETAVRETYRIDGEYKITREDYINGVNFEDAVSNSFYPVDLHRNGQTIYQEFLKPGVVGKIPLRALIPKQSKNFLVAGRCLSSDRMANSALRVQASCMGMGQAAAVAAHLASKNGITPLEVPIKDIRTELQKHGAIVPDA